MTLRAQGIVLSAVLAVAPAMAQRRPMDPPSTLDQNHRTRLILKDGTYQLVLTYKIDGGIVRYRSAERGGEVEDIPLSLVDMDATRKWERDHAAGSQAGRPSPVLSPELRKEEADRLARTPEVAPNLRLPDEDSVLVLDTYQATPQLVPLSQNGSDLNKQTAHNLVKGIINPLSSPHQLVEIKGEKADVQLHVPDPVLYIRVGKDDDAEAPAGAITVDTHGASDLSATSSAGSDQSQYVIVRADVRQGLRVLSSFRIGLLGGVKRQADVVETTTELLPGGHWMRVKPREPLEFGEYALMEVLNDKQVNLDVWDFGVHPGAPANADAIHPEVRRPATLERRRSSSDN